MKEFLMDLIEFKQLYIVGKTGIKTVIKCPWSI